MQTRKTTIEDFEKIFSHPSTVLFRSIELKAIFEITRGFSFSYPSLDLGCGNGAITNLLFDDKFSFGLDNDEAGDVQEAIEKKSYGEVLIEDAEKISLGSDSVGFVFSNCVLEHIPNINKVILELGRIVRPGGDLVFTVPSQYFAQGLYLSSFFSKLKFNWIAKKYIQKRNQMLNHFHMYGPDKWRKLLGNGGFEILDFDYYVSKDDLMLWDKMALEVYLRKFFDSKAEGKIFEKYKKEIIGRYLHSRASKNIGAGLVVLAKKLN